MKITSTKKKDRMKAVVYEKFGTPEVLKIKDVPKPGLKKNEVLVRILASTVSIEDPRMRSAEFDWPLILRIIGGLILGFKKPKKQVLGIEFAGTIEQVGQNVIRLKKGDHVYGYTGIGLGAHAQFKCMPEKGIIALKPTNMTFAESAAIPNGALTSLVYLRKKGRIRKGEHVLINGASGAVGTAAVQLAKFYGAKVTGVCSETNLELGETFEETALREAKEEVGILLGTLTLLGIYSGKEMYYEYPNGDKIYNVVVAYSTNEYSGELFEEVYI
jgi:alcohol dehydrogenase